jgi:uncharacterized protein DUF6152
MQARIAGLGTIAAAVFLASAPASAHHAIGSVVDTSRNLENTMVLTKVDWINPHAWFHFSMTRPDGSTIRDVAVEWMGLSGLRQQGYEGAAAFPVGRTYTVTYYPNRDGSPGGHLVSMIDQSTRAVIGRGAPRPPVAPPLPTPVGRERYAIPGQD